jgi:predicted amidohydrolase YtcJ
MGSIDQHDVILHNGVIHTFNHMDDVAAALVITNDRIAAVGGDDEILDLAGSETEVINLEGRGVIPGLTDSHIHIKKYAQHLDHVNCEVSSLAECLQIVRSAVEHKSDDEWILGHGWNQNQWTRFGNRADLDTISHENPIYLTAKSLHAGWANSRALQIAGIGKDSTSPTGGEIQIDSKGEPTGILFENAMQLVSQHIPSPSDEELASLLVVSQNKLWQLGITGFHDFDGSKAFSALQLLHERGELGIRVLKNIPVDNLAAVIEIGLRPLFGDAWLRLGNVKIFSDGALGPHTAAMFDPYDGGGDNTGMLLHDSEAITEIGKTAIDAGFGLCVHAIGDRANNAALDAFENLQSFQNNDPGNFIRHRIEHLQLLHPHDLQRVSKLGIVASMQPIHATSDMEMAAKFWGDRSRYAYPWRTVLDSGATLAFGSDAPVEDPNPFIGIHAAITRQRFDGSPTPNGWIPEEKITLMEAFKAYTSGPAFASGQENEIGKIIPGYFADLIVLEEDPFELENDQIRDIDPVGTMVGGVWRFRNL